MKRRITTATAVFAVVLAALLAAALPAFAEAVTYTVDKAHSEAIFQVRHLVSKVSGEFKEFDGTIKMDAANPAASSVTFTIDAASISTDVADRDKHLRSEDFFSVEKYPQITFVSTKIEPKGGDQYAVTGQLTMRGVTKEITLPVTFLGEVKDPWGNTKAGFETAITLNRKDYGINWNKALDQGGVLVGDDVQINVNLEVLKQAAAKDAPAAR
jgi:polyisoprenoid-binding protein YceI